MIVVLEDAVFAAQLPPLLLLAMLRHGSEERHVILVDPPFKKSAARQVNAWLQARDPEIRDVATATLEAGLRSYATTASKVEVRVVAGRKLSHWNGQPPELTPADAALLLEMPLQLVMEDRITDRHFLLCVAPPQKRKELEYAFRHGWLRAEHGGGLGSMKRYVESMRDEPAERLRSWLLFDSDRQSDQELHSKNAGLLKSECAREGTRVEYHLLKRRSIENYLPPQALWSWAGRARGRASTDRQKLVREFESMKQQRYFIDMKAWFGDDHIANIFREEEIRIDPEWLRQDGQQPEIDAIMQSLFERM